MIAVIPFASPSDTLAGMIADRWRYQRTADALAFEGEHSLAVLWQAAADDMAERIAERQSQIAHAAAARIAHDRDDVPERTEGTGAVAYLAGAVLILAVILLGVPAYCLLLVWTGGISL